jgi:D-alanyl-D-alanine carboxypeptidase/D-alanyl-D-alanine-endopeptidase (penicillin-binding protein 4)
MKQIFLGVTGGLVSGLLILAVLFFGPLAPAEQVAEPVETTTTQPPATLEPANEPTEEPSEEPTEEPVQCSVTEAEDAEDILNLQAQVVNATTGEVLFDRGSQTPARTASVMKLLTAAAALETLGPDYQITTRVYVADEDPSVLYLVGAGDVTLSRTGPGVSSVYRNAPKLSDLAKQIEKELPEQSFSKIVLDSSLYGVPEGEYQDVWDRRGLTDGYMSYVSALQVDGDRDNPAILSSPRSTDPVMRAGEWFQEALGAAAELATFEVGIAPADAVEVASVKSAPMATWIDYMLQVSDNTLAEAMARLVSLDVGMDGSFKSLTAAYQKALANTDLDLAEIKIEDGSGLSRYNQVAPATINQLLMLIDEGYGDFALIDAGMPVSGTPGSLSSRFLDVVGKVVAKTGWIRTGYSLAGFLYPEDGSKLLFTIYNLGESVRLVNRDAMDELVLAFYNCGANLVNR